MIHTAFDLTHTRFVLQHETKSDSHKREKAWFWFLKSHLEKLNFSGQIMGFILELYANRVSFILEICNSDSMFIVYGSSCKNVGFCNMWTEYRTCVQGKEKVLIMYAVLRGMTLALITRPFYPGFFFTHKKVPQPCHTKTPKLQQQWTSSGLKEATLTTWINLHGVSAMMCWRQLNQTITIWFTMDVKKRQYKYNVNFLAFNGLEASGEFLLSMTHS